MFGTILMAVVTVMQVYVFWRASSVPLVLQHISRKRLVGIAFAVWILFLVGRVGGSDEAGKLATVLELSSLTWMAMLFLMAVALLSVDLATGFGLCFKRFLSRLRGVALGVGIALSVIALVQGLRAPVVQSYSVSIPGLPEKLDGTVVIALSDLHLGNVLGERWLEGRIDQVQAERPDIVVLLGDVFEGHGTPGKELLAALRRLSAPQGVWGVLGNHESHTVNANNDALFKEAGVRLLHNAWVELRPGLVLAGVDDLAASRDIRQAENFLTAALAGRPSGASILLSHAPAASDLAAEKGVNLMLSGHTHGGQLWPFDYLVRQRFPLFEGRYEIGGMSLIVSRGTGTWGPRMRLWHPAEILRVTLHSGAANSAVSGALPTQ